MYDHFWLPVFIQVDPSGKVLIILVLLELRLAEIALKKRLQSWGIVCSHFGSTLSPTNTGRKTIGETDKQGEDSYDRVGREPCLKRLEFGHNSRAIVPHRLQYRRLRADYRQTGKNCQPTIVRKTATELAVGDRCWKFPLGVPTGQVFALG